MPSDDRDRQLEKALARHLHSALHDSSCPDAETLAAYHERTLSLEEMAQWKQHISTCSRCQETLALVEESNILQGSEEEKLKMRELAGTAFVNAAVGHMQMKERLSTAVPVLHPSGSKQTPKRAAALRWVVPVGALAAGLLAWVAVRESHQNLVPRPGPIEIAESRRSDASVPAPSAPPPLKTLPNRDEETVTRSRALNELRKQKAPASESSDAIEKKAYAGTAVGAREAPMADKLKAEADSKAKDDLAALRNAPAPAAPTDVYNYAAQNIELPPTQNAQAPTATSKAGAANQVANTGRLTGQQNQAANMKSQVTENVEVSAAKGALQSLKDVLPEGGTIIVAPNDAYSWRVGSGGKIEHSTDNSRTWMLQKSGVTADLTAGSATSGKICWVVGKAGTVLLTTDRGKHWKQLTAPTKEDLGGVNAVDDKRASIWTASHTKSFETNDGGATWTPVGNK